VSISARLYNILSSVSRWIDCKRDWLLLRYYGIAQGVKPPVPWREREQLPLRGDWPTGKYGQSHLVIGAVKVGPVRPVPAELILDDYAPIQPPKTSEEALARLREKFQNASGSFLQKLSHTPIRLPETDEEVDAGLQEYIKHGGATMTSVSFTAALRPEFAHPFQCECGSEGECSYFYPWLGGFVKCLLKESDPIHKNGPHLLTVANGDQAYCSGDPRSCKFCTEGRPATFSDQGVTEDEPDR